MTVQRPGVVVLTSHARHVVAAERSRFANAARDVLAGSHDGLVLETCHRAEVYLAPEAGRASHGARLAGSLPPGGRRLVGAPAIRHVVGVAIGLDSIAVGEDQILHQLRAALAEARAAGGLDGRLERLCAVALRAGRRARSWRQGPAPSLADVALGRIAAARARRVGVGDEIVVLGAGEMARLTARSAASSGARLVVASRTPVHAAALAAEVGGRCVAFDPGPGVASATGVIVALRGEWKLGPATATALLSGSAIVVDLSVPAAVPASLSDRLGDQFVSADSLARLADETSPALAGRDRLERLVERSTAEIEAWLAAGGQRAVARALAERAETERQAEVAELWRRLPPLDPEVRDLIDGMSRHLARRLLRDPIERLGDDPDGSRARAVRDAFGL